jgi:excinuclease ABC subunit C
LVDENDEENKTEKKSFAYRPSLLLVDGGQIQVNAAREALDELGLLDIETIGIAKRLEELWKPGVKDPILLPRNSEALFLVQRIRDEAHRFAITKTRMRHAKASLASELDGIKGLGEKKIKTLLDTFGSVSTIREQNLESLLAVPGITSEIATNIMQTLKDVPTKFDPLTGEIIES